MTLNIGRMKDLPVTQLANLPCIRLTPAHFIDGEPTISEEWLTAVIYPRWNEGLGEDGYPPARYDKKGRGYDKTVGVRSTPTREQALRGYDKKRARV